MPTSLALKSNPITVTNYTDGNIHQMYTFSHEETEQTPALTDYRYIGNDPYNYIYFNCDDLNNQTAETCEVWRIIGVFDVDDGTGHYERRIKLVRGSSLFSFMEWDNRDAEGGCNECGKNEWSGSELNSYLNGLYYENLKNSTQDFIDNSKYYLGGRSWDDQNQYGNLEEIYKWERGSNVYSGRSLSWNGKIALMYQSDQYSVYAYEVDNNCYNNPSTCGLNIINAGNSAKGWIYNSNILEGNKTPTYTWFLSQDSGSSSGIFFSSPSGNMTSTGANNTCTVRPVLYLSSDVKIIDGTGEQNNPYKLGF